jgi:hypothetical protein
MSGAAATPVPPRHRRWFDPLAALVIGLVIVAAALLPAVTANSGETTTVRGDVTVSGQPLAFFPVGFWTTGDGVVTHTRTDAAGRFTMDVSATLDGFAYAGTAPDAQHAIVDTNGRQIVRGVIGADPAGAHTIAIYQGHPTATARGLDNSASQVHFTLQEAGRIAGVSPVKAAGVRAVQIRRADNSVVQTLRLDSRSRFRSMQLVPGEYGVVLVPKSPGLPTVADAVVQSGRTTSVTLPAPEAGATVSGTVRTAAGAVGAGIPVLLEQDDVVLQSTATTHSGDWSFAGVPAGSYAVEVGRYETPAAAGASSVEVPIPGATATPTPTPSTATPTPSGTAVSPQTAAIEPVERTSDDVVPQTFAAMVPDVLGTVGVDTEVQEAGRITGRVSRADVVTGTASASVRVVAEEASSGRIVRTAATGADGGYSMGGLVPGRHYRLYAITEPDDPSLAEMGGTTAVATAAGATADIVISEPALTLTGTVSDATGGTVAAGDAALLRRTAKIDSSGAYALQGLVPAAYPVVVTVPKRKASQPVGVVVDAADRVADLHAGPRPAVFKGWFIASGAGIPVVTGAAVDDTGDRVQFGPQTNDGRVRVTGLDPGTYEYDADAFRGTVPAVDGPWFYVPPTGTFSLSDGATVDVGPIVLRVRSH